jgi:hypothetical protein
LTAAEAAVDTDSMLKSEQKLGWWWRRTDLSVRRGMA